MPAQIAVGKFDYTMLGDEREAIQELMQCSRDGVLHQQETLTHIMSVILAVRRGHDILAGIGRESCFSAWIERDWGRTAKTGRGWLRASSVLEEHPGYESKFDLNALTRLSKNKGVPGLTDEVQRRLTRGSQITYDVAGQCILAAKRGFPWPAGVCDDARTVVIRNHEKFDLTEPILLELAEYEDDTQVWLLESVVDQKQTLEQAVSTGEVPGSTVEDVLNDENDRITTFCKSLIRHFNKRCPRSRLLNQECIDAARSSLKQCQATLRSAKGVLCPKCKGLYDEGCESCDGLGRVTALRAEQLR